MSGGRCLVSWRKIKRPKKYGGLGVLDLSIRWIWYEWVDPERPWAGTILPRDATDQQLFRASTVVQLGDGRKAKFWESTWLDGKAPRDIAPHLYKLAWRKNQTVRDDLQDDNWMRELWRMATAEE